MIRQPLVAGLLAAGLVVAPLTAMASSPSAVILRVDDANGKLTVQVSAVGLPTGQRLDPRSVTLSIGNKKVPASGSDFGSSTTALTRTVVLAVDISGSMQGGPLAGAKVAIHAFASAVPADVRIGLVTFGSKAAVVAPPSVDRAVLLATTDALVTKGETSLYDGVLLALRTAGTSGPRAVVVLSDGADTVSTHTDKDVTAKLSRNVLIDVVPFATSVADTTLLTSWAKPTGGRSIAAGNSAQLASAFTAAAADTTNQVVITGDVPGSVGGDNVPVEVTVTVGAATLTASTVTNLPPAALQSPAVVVPPQPTHSATSAPPPLVPAETVTPRVQPHTLFYGGLAGLFVALMVVLAFALGIGRPNADAARVQKSMALYSLTRRGSAKRRAEPSHFGESSVARSAVELADRVAVSRGFDASLSRRLDASGVPLRPGEWVILHLGVALGAALLLLALSGGKPVPAGIGLVLGGLLPAAYLSVKEGRRKKKFAAQLPDMLQLLSGSLSAGYSLPQAFDTAAREGEAPMAAELNRALVQARLGMPLEDALETIGTRMQSKDFDWIVMAIRIQRDVGGNLAEVLTTVAATLRERERLRRQVDVLSAEGKLSGYILFALPVLMALYMILVRPTYISVLWTSSIGLALMAVGIGLQVAGAFWMKKVTTVEV